MAATTRSHAADPVIFRCHGHPRITGSHTKTIELTRDPDVTARATCVIGVGSEHDDRELLRLRGEVEVTVECAGACDTFRSSISPFFVGDDALVFRRGPELRGRTLGFDTTKTAAELDRELVRAAADHDAVVTVTIRELGTGDRRGVLFVVSVPIGNDDDLSPRARKVLEAVDVVLAEDTRRFRDLVDRTGMNVGARITSYHDHNESERAEAALEHLARGARVALVSDAGTPLFSDPGYVVVRRAAEEGFAVSPVPGPSSFLAVLSASGLPVDRFTYAGFLARRSSARRSEIAELAAAGDAFVVHEAPRRVGGLLADLAAVVPDWRLCVGREVTKVFEEFVRGSAADLADGFAAADEDARGEFTIVVAPPDRARGRQRDSVDSAADENVERLVRALLAQGVTPKTVAKALSDLPGVSHKQAYARVLDIAREVTLARVVGKGRSEAMPADELRALRARYEHCAVDAGTGDARFAYHLASERRDWLVVGLDALDAPMGEIAYRAARKPARGGRENLVLLRASVEALPPEVQHIADEVHVLLPWGVLLEGIVRARADVIGGLAALARPGAKVRVILNGEIWLDSTPARYEDLPVPTPAYVADVIEPEFRRAGIHLEPARYLTADEAKGLPTTWARRLGHGRPHPQFVHIEGAYRGP